MSNTAEGHTGLDEVASPGTERWLRGRAGSDPYVVSVPDAARLLGISPRTWLTTWPAGANYRGPSSSGAVGA